MAMPGRREVQVSSVTPSPQNIPCHHLPSQQPAANQDCSKNGSPGWDHPEKRKGVFMSFVSKKLLSPSHSSYVPQGIKSHSPMGPNRDPLEIFKEKLG